MFEHNKLGNLYQQNTNASSFYRSKMILDIPNCFGWAQVVLVVSKLFWMGPNHFGQFQIRLFWTNLYNLDLSKMIRTRPKQIRPVQNDWYSTKNIWTVQNHFGPIEGQGIISKPLINAYQKTITFSNVFFHTFSGIFSLLKFLPTFFHDI